MRRTKARATIFGTMAVLAAAANASAQTTTWTGASSINWADPGNWTNGVPGQTTTALFGGAANRGPLLSTGISVGAIEIEPGAQSYDFSMSSTSSVFLAVFTPAGGLINNSSQQQSFSIDGPARLFFANGATATNFNLAGISNTSLGVSGRSQIEFTQASTAANATITSNGTVSFYDTSSAGGATIFNTGNAAGVSSYVDFTDSSSAGTATIINSGNGITFFDTTSSGGTAKLINMPGSAGLFDISFLSAPGITVGSIAGGGGIALGNRTLTTGADNSDTTFTGIIADQVAAADGDNGTGGSLVKIGTGTLTLDGMNTFTGSTTINAGTIIVGDAASPGASLAGGVTVNVGGALMGYGAIAGAVVNRGVVGPGGSVGTLTVGSYSQDAGGILSIAMTPTAASALVVTGTATLGGTLQLLPAVGAYRPGTIYQVITANEVTGRFSEITNTDPHLVFRVLYDPPGNPDAVDAVLLTGARFGHTPNQQAIAAALISAPDGNPVSNLAGAVVGPDQGLDALDGFASTYMQGAMMQFANAFADTLDEAAGAPVGGSERVALADASPSVPFVRAGRYRMWARGIDEFGATRTVEDSPGSQTTLSGVASGVDTTIVGNARIGLAVAYAHSTLAVQDLPQNGTLDAVAIGLYAARQTGPLVLDGALTLAHDHATTQRSIALIGMTATGSNDGIGTSAKVGLAYPLDLGQVEIEPKIGLDYRFLHEDGFGETGAGAADLVVQPIDRSLLQSSVTLRVARAIDISDDGKAVPQLRVGWAHQFLDPTSRGVESFAALPIADFTTTGTNPGRNGVLVGFALDVEASRIFTLFARYDAALTRQSTDQTATAGLKLTW